MAIHIGTSGWSYRHWKGPFYPESLPQKQWFPHYLRHFPTTELNNSFYRWPTDQMFASWKQKLPPGFLMSVKATRMLTHVRKLQDPEYWIARMTQGIALLGEHLGALLVQLPPEFPPALDRLDGFLARMPDWVKVTVEFRHPAWHGEPVLEVLRRHRSAYCIMSGAGLPTLLEATAPFVYVRMHGPDQGHLYDGLYTDEQLAWWAGQLQEWDRQGREIFIYFNNDVQGYAVQNALTLRQMIDSMLPARPL